MKALQTPRPPSERPQCSVEKVDDERAISGEHPDMQARSGKTRALLAEDQGSALERYRRLTYADASALRFWLFELAAIFLLPLPGGLGIVLRRRLLRGFFGRLGRGVVIGRNCVFRNPQRMFLGDGVSLDDNCLLDARGAADGGLRLERNVIVGRNVQIKSKGGPIRIGTNVNIGANTQIISHTGIQIGDGVAIAGACQITGGTFALSEFNRPGPERDSTSAGPIEIEDGTWLATGVMVLDGVHIGTNSIVSAGSVVLRSVPAKSVVQGNPAKRIFTIR